MPILNKSQFNKAKSESRKRLTRKIFRKSIFETSEQRQLLTVDLFGSQDIYGRVAPAGDFETNRMESTQSTYSIYGPQQPTPTPTDNPTDPTFDPNVDDQEPTIPGSDPSDEDPWIPEYPDCDAHSSGSFDAVVYCPDPDVPTTPTAPLPPSDSDQTQNEFLVTVNPNNVEEGNFVTLSITWIYTINGAEQTGQTTDLYFDTRYQTTATHQSESADFDFPIELTTSNGPQILQNFGMVEFTSANPTREIRILTVEDDLTENVEYIFFDILPDFAQADIEYTTSSEVTEIVVNDPAFSESDLDFSGLSLAVDSGESSSDLFTRDTRVSATINNVSQFARVELDLDDDERIDGAFFLHETIAEGTKRTGELDISTLAPALLEFGGDADLKYRVAESYDGIHWASHEWHIFNFDVYPDFNWGPARLEGVSLLHSDVQQSNYGDYQQLTTENPLVIGRIAGDISLSDHVVQFSTDGGQSVDQEFSVSSWGEYFVFAPKEYNSNFQPPSFGDREIFYRVTDSSSANSVQRPWQSIGFVLKPPTSTDVQITSIEHRLNTDETGRRSGVSLFGTLSDGVFDDGIRSVEID